MMPTSQERAETLLKEITARKKSSTTASFEEIKSLFEFGEASARAFLEKKEESFLVNALTSFSFILESAYKLPAAALGAGSLLEILAENDPVPERAKAFYQKAASYYVQAASMQDPGDLSPARGMFSLATLYENELIPAPEGLDKTAVAFSYLLKAAESDLAAGQISVANWYYAGHGTDPSLKNAVLWMKKAWENKGQLTDTQATELKKDLQTLALLEETASAPDTPQKGEQNNFELLNG